MADATIEFSANGPLMVKIQSTFLPLAAVFRTS